MINLIELGATITEDTREPKKINRGGRGGSQRVVVSLSTSLCALGGFSNRPRK